MVGILSPPLWALEVQVSMRIAEDVYPTPVCLTQLTQSPADTQSSWL